MMGKSGTGKTCSLMSFEENELCLINVLNKPLPFKKTFRSTLASDDYNQIKTAIKKTVKKSIVIDDAGMLITNQFMRNHSKTGRGNAVFDLYNDLGDSFWGLVEFIKKLENDKIVYLIMHETVDEFNNIRPKTVGNLLDKQVCLEGLFTIVLRTIYEDGQYYFRTKTNGNDTAKSPIGLFSSDLIPNDLKTVDIAIREYFNIGE
jgi:hypothetical protein